MTLWIEELLVAPHVEDKLWVKHQVTMAEVEEVTSSDDFLALRGREGLYSVLGRSEAGRYLLIVLAPKGDGVWAVVTARGMTDSERRRYQAQRGSR